MKKKDRKQLKKHLFSLLAAAQNSITHSATTSATSEGVAKAAKQLRKL